jgi:nucleotide-binding universal stress UspA family protein
MIGADLGVRGHGALEFAGWLCSHSRSEAQQQLGAVHVLDARLGNLLRTDLHEQMTERTRQELCAALEQSKATTCMTDAHVVEDISPETGILEVLASSEADALIIGRRAKRENHALVRLGRVARRLLRRLPRPVVVVPPDLDATAIGDGALVLASDLGTSSLAAARFARRVADELSRELVVVHVDLTFEMIPTFWGEPAIVMPVTRRIPMDVDDWARSAGIEPVRTLLAEGGAIENVLDLGRAEHAPLIVCGSRQLDLLDRVFASSMASDLARLADRAVAVVPTS